MKTKVVVIIVVEQNDNHKAHSAEGCVSSKWWTLGGACQCHPGWEEEKEQQT